MSLKQQSCLLFYLCYSSTTDFCGQCAGAMHVCVPVKRIIPAYCRASFFPHIFLNAFRFLLVLHWRKRESDRAPILFNFKQLTWGQMSLEPSNWLWVDSDCFITFNLIRRNDSGAKMNRGGNMADDANPCRPTTRSFRAAPFVRAILKQRFSTGGPQSII